MTDQQSVRLFVALLIPPHVTAALAELQAELRLLLPEVSAAWVAPQNLHVTLHFLGAVPVAALAELAQMIAAAARASAPLGLAARGVGLFPSGRSPRVLWAGIGGAGQHLDALARRLRAHTVGIGAPDAHSRYVAHLTVARLRAGSRQQNARLAALAEQMSGREFGHWHADEIVLLRSDLRAGGPLYSQIGCYRLGPC